MGIIGLVLSIAVFLVAGAAVGALFGLRRRMRFLMAYPIGVGAVTCQMFFYSLAGVPFGFFVISVPWVAAFIAAGFFKTEEKDVTSSCRADECGSLSALELFLVSVIVIQFLFSAVNSVSLPIQGFDAWVIWFVKAKA